MKNKFKLVLSLLFISFFSSFLINEKSLSNPRLSGSRDFEFDICPGSTFSQNLRACIKLDTSSSKWKESITSSVISPNGEIISVNSFPSDNFIIYHKPRKPINNNGFKKGFLLIKTIRHYKRSVLPNLQNRVAIYYNTGFFREQCKLSISKFYSCNILPHKKRKADIFFLDILDSYSRKEAKGGAIISFLSKLYWHTQKNINKQVINSSLNELYRYTSLIKPSTYPNKLFNILFIHYNIDTSNKEYSRVSLIRATNLNEFSAGPENSLNKIDIQIYDFQEGYSMPDYIGVTYQEKG